MGKMSFLSLKSRDIGIDLGTANILVTLNGKGIVYREPAVIAIENQTGNVIAIGNEAKEMLGRTPKEVSAIRPLKDGVIAEFRITEILFTHFINKLNLKDQIEFINKNLERKTLTEICKEIKISR